MLDQASLAKFLGRSLTATEETNFDLYLSIATTRLEELLCVNLATAEGERTFDSRYGYRTVYIDPFTAVDSVTINGDTLDSDYYVIKQNDRYSGSWYNIIEFDTKRRGDIVKVSATWGFGVSVPDDLKLLLARLFAQGSVEQISDSQVKSKKIEDFSVTFKDNATYNEFVLANGSVIDKYSQCNKTAIRHGAVGYHDLRSFRSY